MLVLACAAMQQEVRWSSYRDWPGKLILACKADRKYGACGAAVLTAASSSSEAVTQTRNIIDRTS